MDNKELFERLEATKSLLESVSIDIGYQKQQLLSLENKYEELAKERKELMKKMPIEELPGGEWEATPGNRINRSIDDSAPGWRDHKQRPEQSQGNVPALPFDTRCSAACQECEGNQDGKQIQERKREIR